MPTVSVDTIFACVSQAHAASALRGNLSHQALALAAQGSGDYTKAIAAALMTIGGLHAPLLQTYDFLTGDPAHEVEARLAAKQRIPGWGNAFVKGTPDPIWHDMDQLIRAEDPQWGLTLDAVTEQLHAAGRRLYPNPSCYTVIAGILLGVPKPALPYLFLNGRLTAWTNEFIRVTNYAPSIHSRVSA